jgi:uncharacterized DUF497 family protein
MIDTEFEWDEAKAEANLRKRKISFQQAQSVFDDIFAVVEQDLTEEYGESRFLATGMVGGLVITVVYTERGERFRIISARRATSYEHREYYRSQAPL